PRARGGGPGARGAGGLARPPSERRPDEPQPGPGADAARKCFAGPAVSGKLALGQPLRPGAPLPALRRRPRDGGRGAGDPSETSDRTLGRATARGSHWRQSLRLEATPDDLEAVAWLGQARERILRELSKRVVGQQEVIDHLLVSLFAQGHCLFVGVP